MILISLYRNIKSRKLTPTAQILKMAATLCNAKMRSKDSPIRNGWRNCHMVNPGTRVPLLELMNFI